MDDNFMSDFVFGSDFEKTRLHEENLEFLHRGIAARNFRRSFRLAEAIKVGDASYKDGLLHIYLEREVPDHQKPRKIKISS